MHLNHWGFWEQGRERGWWWIQMFTQPLLLDWLALLKMCLATQSPEPSGLVSIESTQVEGTSGTNLHRLYVVLSFHGNLYFWGRRFSVFLWNPFSPLCLWYLVSSWSPIFLGLSWYFSSTFFSSLRLSIIVILGAWQGEEKKNACVQSAMFNQSS